jgi:hypothetical protein
MLEVVDVRACRMTVWRYRMLIAGAVVVWAAIGIVLTHDLPKSVSVSSSVEFSDSGIPGVKRALGGSYQRQYLIDLVGVPEAARAVAVSGDAPRLDIERFIEKNIIIEYKTARLDIRVVGYDESATRWLAQKLLSDIERRLDTCSVLATKLGERRADVVSNGANRLVPLPSLAKLERLAEAEGRLQSMVCRFRLRKDFFPDDQISALLAEMDMNAANHRVHEVLTDASPLLQRASAQLTQYLNEKRIAAVREALVSDEQYRAHAIAQVITKRSGVAVQTTPSKYLLLVVIWGALGLILGLVVVAAIQMMEKRKTSRMQIGDESQDRQA